MSAESDLETLCRRLERLAAALEHLVQNQSRRLAQDDHNAARARLRAQTTGPISPEAIKAVETKYRKKGLL